LAFLLLPSGYPWPYCYWMVCMLKPQEWCEGVQYLKLIMHFPKQNVKLRRCSVSWWNMIRSTSPLGLYSLSLGHGTCWKHDSFPPKLVNPGAYGFVVIVIRFFSGPKGNLSKSKT
jgi:hypothetical protein